MSVWSDVILGLVLVAGGCWLVRTIYSWRRFRRSIQVEIYSNYMEYAFRKKNLTRLSESWYYKTEFGKHRIVYQLARDKDGKIPQAYVLILLSSGVYILNIKNDLSMQRDPVKESLYFERKIRDRLADARIPIHSAVVLPLQGGDTWEKKAQKNLPVIRRNKLHAWLKDSFEKEKESLSNEKIDELYHTLADVSVQAEKYR